MAVNRFVMMHENLGNIYGSKQSLFTENFCLILIRNYTFFNINKYCSISGYYKETFTCSH